MPVLDNIAGMKNAANVAVFDADDLTEEVFLGVHVANSRPCLVKGAIRHWPAMKNWRNPDYLKDRCGHHNVFVYPHENHVTPDRMLPGRTAMNFARAIDCLHGEETEVGTLGLPGELSALRTDLGRFAFFSRAEPALLVPPARQFVYRNAGTAWHYHAFDETFMCQAVGSKKVGLLSTDNPSNKALCDIFFREDYYDDPLVFDALEGAALEWFSADLEEGDALYIPPLWWHGVSTTSPSFGMTVAVTWRSPLPVIAAALRRMAASDIKLLGYAEPMDISALRETARQLGLEKELSVALQQAA